METKRTNNNVVAQLNNVLADLQIVYQNMRAMHWLIKGPDFYQQHKMFEGFYTELADVVDEVAERILTLGGVPYHQFSEYLDQTSIEPVAEVPRGKETLKITVENFEHLLGEYREVLEAASNAGDEGTVALFSELIASTEKKLWMLNATLS